jgi:hypothetical protein
VITNELRLPLVPVEPATAQAVREAARSVGIRLAESGTRPEARTAGVRA